jgi:hypothetical protein
VFKGYKTRDRRKAHVVEADEAAEAYLTSTMGTEMGEWAAAVHWVRRALLTVRHQNCSVRWPCCGRYQCAAAQPPA